ncbi:MAG TPA: energy transducer TonB [Flavobacteriales bacterium]|nr:energy transducer TonB [Flavobacteriales bacterium]HNU57549.1 energy transducer TonB [Flavobacteriales bacterium]
MMTVRSLLMALLLFPFGLRAQELDMRYELVMLYTADLVVDADYVRSDEVHLWVRVNAVLVDTGYGIVKGDHLRIDRAASTDCGYPWSLGQARRWRFYLQKEEGKGHWALQEHDAVSAVPVRDGRTTLNMPALLELGAAELDRWLVEFRTCYGPADQRLSFPVVTTAGRLDSLAAHNPVIAQLEAQGRTIDPVRLYPDPVERVPVVPAPAPVRECAWLEQQPTTLGGAPLESLFQERLVDPSPQALGGGPVILRALIDASGQWQDIEVLRASTPRRDAAALQMGSQLPMVRPGELRGSAVPCLFTFPVRFKHPE